MRTAAPCMPLSRPSLLGLLVSDQALAEPLLDITGCSLQEGGRGVRKRRRQMWRGGSQPPCIGAQEQINMRTLGTIRRGCWARCWGRRGRARPGQAAGWALVMACMALCVRKDCPKWL